MKLRTTVGALLDAFALINPTLDRKGSSANLYLNASEKTNSLYLYSTNFISETVTRIKLQTGELETPGEVLVNPSKLADGLQALPKDTPVHLNLTPTANALKVQAANVKFSLAANTSIKELADKMRAVPWKLAPVTEIPITELSEFTGRSAFCIPNDQTGQRANLAALKLITGEACEEAFATDGSIAVHISSSKKQGKGTGWGASGLLIPVGALPALKGLANKRKKGETVRIIPTANQNKVFFRFADDTYFGSLVMITQYPNLKTVIDQKLQYTVEVPRESFGQSLTRAGSFVSSAATKKIIELEFSKDEMVLCTKGDEPLTDKIAIKYIGGHPEEAVKLGMNIDYLASIASSSQSEFLTLQFTKEDKPLIITDMIGEEEERIDIKYVVMGIRTK